MLMFYIQWSFVRCVPCESSESRPLPDFKPNTFISGHPLPDYSKLVYTPFLVLFIISFKLTTLTYDSSICKLHVKHTFVL